MPQGCFIINILHVCPVCAGFSLELSCKIVMWNSHSMLIQKTLFTFYSESWDIETEQSDGLLVTWYLRIFLRVMVHLFSHKKVQGEVNIRPSIHVGTFWAAFVIVTSYCSARQMSLKVRSCTAGYEVSIIIKWLHLMKCHLRDLKLRVSYWDLAPCPLHAQISPQSKFYLFIYFYI